MKTKLILGGLLFTGSSYFAQSTGTHITPLLRTGFNTSSPFNRVEIAGDASDPYGTLINSNGCSGLRFTNLTSNKTPLTVNSGKVLSVDANGDVILVTDQTVGGNVFGAQNGLSVASGGIAELGGPLNAASAAQLLSDREIPMNNKNLLFSGLGSNGNNRITIGGNTAYLGKLSVRANEITNTNTSESYAASFENNYAAGSCGGGYFAVTPSKPVGSNVAIQGAAANAFLNYGIYMEAGPAFNQGSAVGGNFIATNTAGTGGAVGVAAEAFGGAVNIGVKGVANSPVGRNYGGIFEGGAQTSAQTTYGLQSTTNAIGSLCIAGDFSSPPIDPLTNLPIMPATIPATNYGIRAYAPANWPNSYAVYSDGDLQVNGIAFCSTFWSGSDRRFKKNINKLENMTDKILKLNGYTYNFRAEEFKSKNFDKNEQIGFIAQELKEVFPQMVRETGDGYLAVNYESMVPVLLEVSKEQQLLLDKQREQINVLKDLLQSIVSRESAQKPLLNQPTQISTSLSDKNVLVLNQNVPNPFAESTVITYNIPNDFNRAQIIFTTSNGHIIKSVDLKVKGAGAITIYADDLSHGAYTYSLIVDGKTIDSKKMIKE